MKKAFAIFGIILTLIHLTYYFVRPYNTLLWFLGFAVIYLVFVYPLRKHS